jgi:crotonobetainyl-CoA:carnitine CoA-transferase CaiB-like acyl-CoA transferase
MSEQNPGRRAHDEVVALTTALGVALPPVTIEHPAPVLPSVFRVDVAASAAVAVTTAAVAAVQTARTGVAPDVTVDGRAAQIAFRSERYLRVDGNSPGEVWGPLAGDYRCADGWVKIHANFPHHADAAVRALGVEARPEALAAALRSLPGETAEAAVVDAGGVAAAMRTAGEWAAHDQGRVEATTPVVRLRPLPGPGGATGRTLASASVAAAGTGADGAHGPLAGLRVLDLTRVIAGPLCGRILTAHGADVLAVTAPHLAQIEPLWLDTAFGKRSAFLDLRRVADRARFDELLSGADAVVQSFRPGALAALGYGPEALAARFPGLVVVDVRAYSPGGPWAARRGFDSLVQMVCGIADEGRAVTGAGGPVPLPCQALDHATGWLAAAGLLAALVRREHEGGSWHVELSLASTAVWLDRLGRHDRDALALGDPGHADVEDLLSDLPGPTGRLRHVTMPGRLDGRAAVWRSGPPVRGSSAPRWLGDA